MAIAASYFTVATGITSSTAIYTTSTTAYHRDLVITSSGASTVWVALGAAVTSAATTSSFAVPTGCSLVLTAGQVPTGAKIFATSSGTAAVSIGYGSLVNVT